MRRTLADLLTGRAERADLELKLAAGGVNGGRANFGYLKKGENIIKTCVAASSRADLQLKMLGVARWVCRSLVAGWGVPSFDCKLLAGCVLTFNCNLFSRRE